MKILFFPKKNKMWALTMIKDELIKYGISKDVTSIISINNISDKINKEEISTILKDLLNVSIIHIPLYEIKSISENIDEKRNELIKKLENLEESIRAENNNEENRTILSDLNTLMRIISETMSFYADTYKVLNKIISKVCGLLRNHYVQSGYIIYGNKPSKDKLEAINNMRK